MTRITVVAEREGEDEGEEEGQQEEEEVIVVLEKPRRHHLLKPIYLFETSVRAWLVTTPRVLAKRFPSFNRTISLVFMYMMFQVLAILGAFLLNAICSVTLDISGLAARHAFDFSLSVSIVHGFSTFYVTYSTIRVFVRFGQAIGVIAWESLDDFPDARKIVNNATSTWPMFIFIVFIPQCMMAFSLVGTPWLCEGVAAPDNVGGVFSPVAGPSLPTGLSQAFPFKLDWHSMMETVGQAGLGDHFRGFVCARTPLLYFTRPYPNPRRTMSAVLVVGLVQYTQILLHRFPNWRADMRATGQFWRVCVHFSLLACLCLTGRWLVGWVAFQLGLDATGLVVVEWVRLNLGLDLPIMWNYVIGGMNIQESGLELIMAWTLWVAMVAYVLCGNASSAVPKDQELKTFFQNLKTSFIVAVSFFFLRGCASPTMGFIEAQQELTILTIVIPILYVALYTTVNAALQLSVGLVVFGGPAAMVMSVQLCRSSGFGGPGTFVVVFLHIFIKLIQLFGDDAFTNPERDGYDEGDARGRSASAPGTPMPSSPYLGSSSGPVFPIDENVTISGLGIGIDGIPHGAGHKQTIDDYEGGTGESASVDDASSAIVSEDGDDEMMVGGELSPIGEDSTLSAAPEIAATATAETAVDVDIHARWGVGVGVGAVADDGGVTAPPTAVVVDVGCPSREDSGRMREPQAQSGESESGQENVKGVGNSSNDATRQEHVPQRGRKTLADGFDGGAVGIDSLADTRENLLERQGSVGVLRGPLPRNRDLVSAWVRGDTGASVPRAASASPSSAVPARRQRIHIPFHLPSTPGGGSGTGFPRGDGGGGDRSGNDGDANGDSPLRVGRMIYSGSSVAGEGVADSRSNGGGGISTVDVKGSLPQIGDRNSTAIYGDHSGNLDVEQSKGVLRPLVQDSTRAEGTSIDMAVGESPAAGEGAEVRPETWSAQQPPQQPAVKRWQSERLHPEPWERLASRNERGTARAIAPVGNGRGGEFQEEEREGDLSRGLGGAVGGYEGTGWGEPEAGWDKLAPAWPYATMGRDGGWASATDFRRSIKTRSLSVDDLLSMASQRHDEWKNWDRRSTARYDQTNPNGNDASPSPSPSAAAAVASLTAEGWAENETGDGADHPRTSGGSGGGQNGASDHDEYRNSDHNPLAWMQSVMDGNRGVIASGLAAMETNAQFVFKGTIRGAAAFLAILSLFLASCQIISLLQEEHEWYPSLIKYSVTDSKQLVVDNAFVVKATLETTGDPVIVEPRYASCGSKWHGLSLLDYALLAELAYFDQHDKEVPLSEVAKQFFPDKRGGPDFKIKMKHGDHHSHAQFFEAYSAKLNVSVIAIRGTDVGRISDLIEDIKIWVEPIVLKGLSMVFPTIRIWPDSTSSVVIEWLHETLQLFGLQQQAHYYRPLVEYVRAITDRDVVLTGHSLGGGLARIVGALEKATSICFSPPGIAQSYRKFSVGAGALDRAFLHQMSVSVIPEHDFVPMIDTQVGLIQLISCSTAGKALQLSCHMLEGTICDLVRHCGDDRGRFTDCKFEYNMSHLLPQVLNLLQGKMIWVMGLASLIVIIAVLIILPEFLV